MMSESLPRNYDAWKTGPFGRFETDQERRSEVYSDALSERDSDLREDANLLAEVFGEAITDPPIAARLEAILQASACYMPPHQIGEALTRLVGDIIKADSERYAEKEASR